MACQQIWKSCKSVRRKSFIKLQRKTGFNNITVLFIGSKWHQPYPSHNLLKFLRNYIFIHVIFYPQNVFMTAELRAHNHKKKSSVVKPWSEMEEEEDIILYIVVSGNHSQPPEPLGLRPKHSDVSWKPPWLCMQLGNSEATKLSCHPILERFSLFYHCVRLHHKIGPVWLSWRHSVCIFISLCQWSFINGSQWQAPVSWSHLVTWYKLTQPQQLWNVGLPPILVVYAIEAITRNCFIIRCLGRVQLQCKSQTDSSIFSSSRPARHLLWPSLSTRVW